MCNSELDVIAFIIQMNCRHVNDAPDFVLKDGIVSVPDLWGHIQLCTKLQRHYIHRYIQ